MNVMQLSIGQKSNYNTIRHTFESGYNANGVRNRMAATVTFVFKLDLYQMNTAACVSV